MFENFLKYGHTVGYLGVSSITLRIKMGAKQLDTVIDQSWLGGPGLGVNALHQRQLQTPEASSSGQGSHGQTRHQPGRPGGTLLVDRCTEPREPRGSKMSTPAPLPRVGGQRALTSLVGSVPKKTEKCRSFSPCGLGMHHSHGT